MVLIPVVCPDCKSDNVGKNGRDQKGVQRYLCRNAECPRKTFALEYTYKAYEKGTRQKVLDMTVNGNGTRAIARVLGINKDTVTAILKKRKVV